MKFTKLSLAALVAMGIASSASAVENVKVDGQIKLWYQTMDTTTNPETPTSKEDGLFKKNGGTGDLAAKLRATGDLTKKVGFGMTFYALTSAGLENNLVNDVAAGSASSFTYIDVDGSGTYTAGDDITGTSDSLGKNKNPYWLGEAYFTYKAGNTIAKIGRQELDTPLAYTETWNAAPNTFEAMVLVNQDLPSTTLVGAYVSRGNGATDILGGANGKTITSDGSFYTLGTAAAGATPSGAWALGAVTTLIPMTTAQAWYYDVEDAARAYWLQADAKLPFGIGLGLQYANLSAEGKVKKTIDAAGTYDTDTNAYAVQATYSVAGVNLAAAYSSVSEGTLAAANVATGFKKTKLYTASILADGTLAALPAVDSWKVAVGTKIAGFDLGASYGSYDAKENTKGYLNPRAATATFKSNEVDVHVGTKIDDVNLVVYYINQSEFNAAKDDRQAIRAIASINF